MLYLEDYLEMIEQLPMDFRERFTEMREMDLQVQNDMDNMDDKVKTFFEAAKKAKPEQSKKEFEGIRKDYYKILDDCDEKVQVANQMYDLIDRYLRKLDQELSKFKMELEADNAGITELLERRSLQLDQPPKVVPVKGEKRKLQSIENHLPNKVSSASPDDLLSTLATEAAQEIPSYRVSGTTNNSSTINPNNSRTGGGGAGGGGADSRGGSAAAAAAAAAEMGSPQPALSYSLGHVGAGSNAIAMAAAQAVSNTLQMQQGRRTASLKASYEALKSHGFSLNIGREYGSSGNATNAAGASPSAAETSRNQRSRRQTHKAAAIAQAAQEKQQHQQQQAQQHAQQSSSTPVTTVQPEVAPQQPVVELQPGGATAEDSTAASTSAGAAVEWTYDPNEPRYCLCNQVSYGEMVGCDNDNCPIEWFHYGCVGITNPPKGKWYCPQCAAAMKRREKKDPNSKR